MGNSYNDAQYQLIESNKNQIILNNSLTKNKNKDINNKAEKETKKDDLNSKLKSKNISNSLSTIKEERNSTIKSNEKNTYIDNVINNNSIINNKEEKEIEIKKNKDIKENEDKEKLNNFNQIIDDKIKTNISMKKTEINNKEEEKENNEQDSVKINQNLYEFVNNNYKYYHYDEQYVHKKPVNNQNILNTKFSLSNIDDTLSSQNTIYNTNNDAEFFFDNSNRNDANTEYRSNNNKNNIFNNVIEYKYKPSNKNNNNNNNIKKLRNSKKYNQIKIYNKYNIESITKIHQTNNNLLLVSSFLSNKNISKNINYKPHTSEKNKLFHPNKNEASNNMHKNFSFKNVSNNDDDAIIHQKKNDDNPFKENYATKSIKNNINEIIMRMQNKYDNEYKNSINQIPLNTQSYNYNNFYTCNDYNYNFTEKQKMSELIEKIPNNDLKNEIKVLYQRIINYNNEIILSNKNTNFDYIITFSNNYIFIDDKKFTGNNFDESKLKKLNLIKISLLSNKNYKFGNEDIDKINLKSQNIVKNSQYNIIPKVESEIINNKNLENTTSISSNINSKNTSNKKFELISVDNKTWKKIINLNDVIVNNDKIFPLTVIEQNNLNLAKSEVLTRINSVNNVKRNYSTNCKTSHEKQTNKSGIKEIKTTNSIDIYNSGINSNNASNKWDKFYIKSLKNEKIIFEKNMVKLLKVNNLLNSIKNSKKNKNILIKEDNLIMFPVICLLSKDSLLIFKDKEKSNPMIKKNLNLIQKVMIFKKSYKHIVIINFSDLNMTSIKNKENDENEKDKNLGLIIDKENYYKEFIGLLKQLIPNLIIVNLN